MADTRVIIRAEAEQAVREFNRLRAEASGSLQQIAAAGNKVIGVLQSIGVAASAGQIIAMSDEYAKFTAQLKLATESQREYGVAYADVKRIANESQQGLSTTGVLYAKIANGTRELGVSQQRVAAITETVNLALKVSGATATEASSAQLQLSQSFASGTLRGEEFNAVNEAAPRLMLALAEGIGVPIGALKKMSEEGQITSKIMADVLPNALLKLREEATQVQTISGSFTVLKNTVMEFVGVQANASGAVSAITSGIGALSENLAFLSGTFGILLGLKTAGWLAGVVSQTYASVTATVASVAANSALVASNVATATSEAAAAAAANALAVSRVAELRAAVLAAEGNVALAITTNGLIPAEANAARAAAALAAANTGLAAAQSAATVTSRALTAAMALLSGPIGIIITVLGAGAAAWALWGKSSKDANDQAAASTEASGNEILASLEKQNSKLRDRLMLAKAGNVDAAKVDSGSTDKLASTLRQINEIKAKGVAISSLDQLALIDLESTYESISQRLKENKDLTAAISAVGAQSKAGDWMVKYATQSEKLEAELKKARTELGDAFTPELEARIKKQYEVKAAGSAKESSAYATLISSVRQKVAASADEAAGLRAFTESQKLTVALNEQLAAGKIRLSPLEKSAYLAAVESLAVNERVIEAQKRAAEGAAAFAKLEADTVEKAKQKLDGMIAEAAGNERLVETFGMTKGAIEALELARLEEQLAQRSSVGMTSVEISELEKLIDAKRRNVSAVTRLGDLEDARKGAEDLEKFLDPAKAQTFGEALRDAFGGAGGALSKLTGAFQSYARNQATFDQQRGNAAKKYLNGLSDEAEYAKDLAGLNKQRVSDQLGGYGDMAGAAAGFFNEQSKGYKVLQGVSQAFHLAQLALNLASIAPAIAAGAAQMFAQSGFGGFAGVAAMVGLMAGLGAVTSGGGGGGPSAKQRQESQGTGSVFGDKTAKSDSIRRSIEQLTSNSADMLPINQGMLTALQSIEASMAGLTNLVVRTPGLTDGSNMGIQTGTIKQSLQINPAVGAAAGGAAAGAYLGSMAGAFLGPVGIALGGVLGSALGGIASKVVSLWGKTSQAIVDSGIQYAGRVRDLQGGKGFDQYASVDTTKKSFFGLSKKTSNSVKTEGLNDELSNQFGMIFTNLDKSLQAASVALGGSAADVTKVLDNLTLESSKVSLKGLTGTALTDALNSVISKSMDEIAQAAFPQFDSFRKVGEGYAETIMRLAGDYAKLDSILASSSTTFGVTGIASVAARERLIELTGGIENFAGQSKTFTEGFLSKAEQLAPVQKYVTEQLAAMGLQNIDTRDKFKDYALGLANSGKLATEAGAQQYASLLALSEAFAKTHAATVDLTKSEQEIADERKDLQSKLDELTMTQAQLAEKARVAIDGHNRGLYDQVVAAQAAKDALSETSAILDLQGQMYAANGDKAGAAAVLEAQHRAALVGLTPVLTAATKATWAAQAAQKVIADATTEHNAILTQLAELYAATGDKVAAAVVLEQQHQAALVGLTPALAAATQATWDAQKAEQAKKDALAESNTLLGIQAQIYELTGDKAGAAAVLQKQHLAALVGLTPAVASATQQLWGLQEAAARSEAMSSFGNALADSMDKAKDAAKAFRELNDALLVGDSSTLNPEQKYLEAKRQFETADPANLAAAEKTFLDASKSWFGGSAGYAKDFAAVLALNSSMATKKDAEAAAIADFWKSFVASGGWGNIGAHAKGGVASGWSLVGEEGPELVNFTQPGRVYTASQSRNMMSPSGGSVSMVQTNALLEKVLIELRADKAQRGAVSEATIQRLETVAEKLDGSKRAASREAASSPRKGVAA